MNNDNELDLTLDELDSVETNAENKLKVKNRFEKLSEKVILTSKEKEELAKAKEALENEKNSLAKERDFYKDFSVNVSKYPQASDFQDKILEKVKQGYATEDAIVSVLNKEGKLTASVETKPAPQVEGGSAPTTFEGEKGLSDMTAEEKRNALLDADKRGEVERALRGR